MNFKIIHNTDGELLFEGMLSECCDYCEDHSYWIMRFEDCQSGENWYVEVRNYEEMLK
jgi:hypothetical protein